MIKSQQFEVNEAWIAFKVNKQEILIENTFYDIYMLMDAASLFVFGQVIFDVENNVIKEEGVETLFKKAWSQKENWAEKLIIADDSLCVTFFEDEAVKNGLQIQKVKLAELEYVTKEIIDYFPSN